MKIRRFTQFRLIYSHKKEAAAPGISGLKPSKYAFFSRFQKAKHAFFFVILAVALIFPVPKTVFAFSIFDALFGKKPVKQEQNSQTVALLKANLSPDLVARGGGDITIVDDMALLAETGPLGTIADVGETPQNGQIFKYVVREEDSLLSISKMFDGVSVNTIRWANNLTTSTVIRPGQILIIFPIDSIQHTVAKNETFEGIVKRYGGDINETLAFNGWPPGYKPEVGTIVVVPNGEGEPLSSSGDRVVRGSGGLFEDYYGVYYLRPVIGGYISQGFHGYNNSGIDLAVALGTPILATDNGYVIVRRCGGWNGGYGCYVVIQHSNKKTQALYAHMSQSIVDVGQYLVRGQVLGYAGSTGRSTGSHLHFELRK